MPLRLLVQCSGDSGNLRTARRERPSWVASVGQDPNSAVPDAHLSYLAESPPPSQFDRNQAQESWICNSSKPNLPRTFLRLLVVGGPHDGKSRIDFSGRRVAHSSRGRELECRFRARRRELPRRAERASAAG